MVLGLLKSDGNCNILETNPDANYEDINEILCSTVKRKTKTNGQVSFAQTMDFTK